VKALEAVDELGVEGMRKHDPISPSTAGSSCASSVRRRSIDGPGGGLGEGGGGLGEDETFKPHEKPAHPDEESQLARHCASVLED
jgi:hypothetical protein